MVFPLIAKTKANARVTIAQGWRRQHRISNGDYLGEESSEKYQASRKAPGETLRMKGVVHVRVKNANVRVQSRKHAHV